MVDILPDLGKYSDLKIQRYKFASKVGTSPFECAILLPSSNTFKPSWGQTITSTPMDTSEESVHYYVSSIVLLSRILTLLKPSGSSFHRAGAPTAL
jgi:hypothetical protein